MSQPVFKKKSYFIIKIKNEGFIMQPNRVKYRTFKTKQTVNKFLKNSRMKEILYKDGLKTINEDGITYKVVVAKRGLSNQELKDIEIMESALQFDLNESEHEQMRLERALKRAKKEYDERLKLLRKKINESKLAVRKDKDKLKKFAAAKKVMIKNQKLDNSFFGENALMKARRYEIKREKQLKEFEKTLEKLSDAIKGI